MLPPGVLRAAVGTASAAAGGGALATRATAWASNPFSAATHAGDDGDDDDGAIVVGDDALVVSLALRSASGDEIAIANLSESHVIAIEFPISADDARAIDDAATSSLSLRVVYFDEARSRWSVRGVRCPDGGGGGGATTVDCASDHLTAFALASLVTAARGADDDAAVAARLGECAALGLGGAWGEVGGLR